MANLLSRLGRRAKVTQRGRWRDEQHAARARPRRARAAPALSDVGRRWRRACTTYDGEAAAAARAAAGRRVLVLLRRQIAGAGRGGLPRSSRRTCPATNHTDKPAGWRAYAHGGARRRPSRGLIRSFGDAPERTSPAATGARRSPTAPRCSRARGGCARLANPTCRNRAHARTAPHARQLRES